LLDEFWIGFTRPGLFNFEWTRFVLTVSSVGKDEAQGRIRDQWQGAFTRRRLPGNESSGIGYGMG
jgi:hypothetical protein